MLFLKIIMQMPTMAMIVGMEKLLPLRGDQGVLGKLA